MTMPTPRSLPPYEMTDSPPSTFSSLLSSLNDEKTPNQRGPNNQTSSTTQRPSLNTNVRSLSANNVSAGVKRKSEEPDARPRPKTAKTDHDARSGPQSATTQSSRFQLSAKAASQKPSPMPQRPVPHSASGPNAQRPISKPMPNQTLKSPTSTTSPVPQKRGFASIMEKAKAAQEVAKAAGPSGIQHKAVEKLTKRERQKRIEEAQAQEKAAKKKAMAHGQGGRSGGAVIDGRKGQEAGHKAPIKKVAEPLAYKGTMRSAAAPGQKVKKHMVKPQDKYGGYASWSDLDDAEEEDEQDYDSEGSSDMEGGFDDVEREEVLATRAAREEDQKYAEEEERHKQIKLERKRKLVELNKNAAAKRNR